MTSKQIERRLFSGTLWGAISFLTQMVQTILFVPLLLKYWGSNSYGLWIAMNALYNIMKTFDAGHQSYIGNELCKLYTADQIELRQTLSSSILMALFIGALQIVISVAIIAFGFFGDAIGIEVSPDHSLRVKFVFVFLVCTWVMYGSIGGILVKLYAPAGLYSRGILWGIAIQITQTLSVLAVVIYGGGVVAALIAGATTQMIVSFVVILDIRNKFKHLYPFWRYGILALGFKNFVRSITLTCVGFLTQLQNSGITLAVTSALGTSMAPVITTFRTIANMFTQATGFITQPLMPELVRYHAQKDQHKITETICTFWLVSGLLINIGLLITLPVIELVYLKWTRHILVFDMPVYLLLAFAVAIKNFGTPMSAYLIGINNLRFQSVATAIQTTAMFVVIATFIGHFGLLAVGWALVLGELFASVVVPIVHVTKELAIKNNGVFIEQTILAAGAVVVTGGFFVLIGAGIVSPFTGSFVGVAVVTFIGLLQWHRLSFEVRRRLVQLMRSLLPFQPPSNAL